MKAKPAIHRLLALFAIGAAACLVTSTAQAEIILYNQSNPPDTTDLPTGGWGSYRGFSMHFDDTAFSAAYTGADTPPLPSTIYLTEMTVRHPGTQGSPSTPMGDWTQARMKIYTTQTPTTASYIGDSASIADMSQSGVERNVTFNFASLPLNPTTTYYFYFSNTEGNVEPSEQTWTVGRLRVSNNTNITYSSGNLVNAAWGNQDTAFDAVFAATFTSSLPNLADITWTGATNNLWDVDATANWELSDTTATTYSNGDTVTFTDGAATGDVQLSGSPINPAAIIIDNPTLDYTFAGDGWGGIGMLTKSGAGEATLAINALHGGGAIINGGLLRIGNGGTTGALGSGTIDNQATLAIARSGTLTFSGALTGPGDLVIEGPGTVILPGTPTYTGNTLVQGGGLNVTGTLVSPVNVADGARLRVTGTITESVTITSGGLIETGTTTSVGTGVVGQLTLENGSRSRFRTGFNSEDIIEITANDGLSITGSHVVDLVPSAEWLPNDEYILMIYQGNLIGDASGFTVGSAPHGSYSILNDAAFGEIYVRINSIDTLVWTGAIDSNWDLDNTQNWRLVSNSQTAPYFEYDQLRFEDGASTGIVQLSQVFSPREFVIDSDTLAYQFSGGGMAGTGGIVKSGTSAAVWTGTNTSTGGTTVNAGTLTIGNGGADGDIGFGPVVVEDGATLGFNLDATQLRAYNTIAKMRNVSGGGDIIVNGGFTLFNYTGGGLAFDSPGTWADFSGNLIVTGESEFRTIRNGATAMGTGDIILGNATTSGHLAQIEGNWTWTNDISLVGANNSIRNRSAGAPRTLKLQGVISGSGGLIFQDPAASMTNTQTGFILTGENTLDGTVTISTGVPLRVGGIPGNTDITQSGAGVGGTLGTANVINNGTLTISRSDAHTMGNPITGSGALFVGLSAGTAGQVLTYTGNTAHTGHTTLRNGTTIVASGASLGGASVTVEGPATLSGSGTIASQLVAAGTIAPGNTVGTLTVNGNSAVTGTLAIQVDGPAADKLMVTGDLGMIGATVTVEELTGGFTAPSYVIAEASGALSGLPSAPEGYQLTIAGNQLILEKSTVTSTPYQDWVAGFEAGMGGLTGPNDDPDGDGIVNAIEFILGGNPTSPNDAQLPTVAATGANLVFSFNRHNTSPELTVTVETSTDLADWSTNYLVAPETPGVTISEGTGPDGSDVITVTIPKDAATARFARLAVTSTE